MLGDRQLEQVVYDTIRYFSLLKMPITEVQIWRSLIAEREARGVRWHGRHVSSFNEIKAVLTQSLWLRRRVGSVWGYYYLKSAVMDLVHENKDQKLSGKQYVRQRLIRHSLAQQKWKIARKIVRLLAWLPFVRMIGGSGSLAMYNTEPASDLDLFIVVKKNRIWTARLFLLIVSQFSGRRRKYWDEVAPDKVCLNHYVTDESLLMSSDVRNLYTAQLYTKLVPLMGIEMYKKWMEANEPWIRQWIMYPDAPILPSRLYLRVYAGLVRGQKMAESFLMEFPGDVIERVAEITQSWAIKKHDQWRRSASNLVQHDRVVISNTELAFHPNTRVPEILKKFKEEEGQGQLL